MAITWNTGLAAERVRHNRRLKNRELNSFKRRPRPKLQASSAKLQASSSKRLKFATMIFNKDIQKEIKNYVKKRS